LDSGKSSWEEIRRVLPMVVKIIKFGIDKVRDLLVLLNNILQDKLSINLPG